MDRSQILIRRRVAKDRFLGGIIEHVYGEDVRLFLVGDLSRCRAEIDAIPGTQNTDSHILQGEFSQSYGTQRFINLPLTAETKDIISRSILPRIGLRSHVWHVLMGRPSGVFFAAYDGFDPRGRVASAKLPITVLDALVAAELVECYLLNPSEEQAWRFYEFVRNYQFDRACREAVNVQ